MTLRAVCAHPKMCRDVPEVGTSFLTVMLFQWGQSTLDLSDWLQSSHYTEGTAVSKLGTATLSAFGALGNLPPILHPQDWDSSKRGRGWQEALSMQLLA